MASQSEQPAPEIASEITVGAIKLQAVKEERSLGNRGISTELGGTSPGLISDWLKGKKRPLKDQRDAIFAAFGVPQSDWDRVFKGTDEQPEPMPVEQIMAVARSVPAPAAAPPPPSGQYPSALELLRGALHRIVTALDGPRDKDGKSKPSELPVAEQTRLMSAMIAAIKEIGKATGELDQSEMQKFKLSAEYRSFVRRITSAVGPCCREAVLRVTGGTWDEQTMSLNGPLGVAELAVNCERVEGHKTIDGLVIAVENLTYPVDERERELAQLDPVLARRVLACLELGHPLIVASAHASYRPADEHRERVMAALKREIERESRFAEFERDFGRVACERARVLS